MGGTRFNGSYHSASNLCLCLLLLLHLNLHLCLLFCLLPRPLVGGRTYNLRDEADVPVGQGWKAFRVRKRSSMRRRAGGSEEEQEERRGTCIER